MFPQFVPPRRNCAAEGGYELHIKHFPTICHIKILEGSSSSIVILLRL